MCLAIPAQISKKIKDDLVLVDFGQGVKREVSVALIGDTINEGDWVLIHTGYAVSKISPEEAKETLKLWEEVWAHERESISP